MATSITRTTLTVTGTPTIFLPLPSAYPSENGCGTNVYQLKSEEPTFLVWDPVYGQSVTGATSCFPSQVTTWWLQSTGTYTALGPTFACPEAYLTVSTNIVATSLQEVYCCPSQFTLLSAQPNTGQYFPSQCTSMLSEGQTLSWYTGMTSGSSHSTTTVFSDSATMFAVPVNGFNLATTASSTVASTTESSVSTSFASATPSQTTTSPASDSSLSSKSSSSSGSPSVGQSVGIAIGAAFAVLVLGVGAFILWRRRHTPVATLKSDSEDKSRHAGDVSGRTSFNTQAVTSEHAPVYENTQSSYTDSPKEMPTSTQALVYELPVRESRYEMQDHERYELPEREF